MNKRLFAIAVAGLLLLSLGTAHAGGRPDKSWKSWFGHFGGGWSLAQGDFSDVADDAWYFDGGATYWPEPWPVGINLDLSWANHDLSGAAIRAINDAIADAEDETGQKNGRVTGGDVDIWSLAVNAMWGPKNDSRVGFYVLGGVGLDRVEGQVTDDALVYYPPVCDPWYWWCYPGGVGPGTVIRGRESATELSYNLGVALTFTLDSGSQIFVEGKYHSIDLDWDTTEVLPLTIGFRW